MKTNEKIEKKYFLNGLLNKILLYSFAMVLLGISFLIYACFVF